MVGRRSESKAGLKRQIAGWMNTARTHASNEEYYLGRIEYVLQQLSRIESIKDVLVTRTDGTRSDEPMIAKAHEAAMTLVEEHIKLQSEVAALKRQLEESRAMVGTERRVSLKTEERHREELKKTRGELRTAIVALGVVRELVINARFELPAEAMNVAPILASARTTIDDAVTQAMITASETPFPSWLATYTSLWAPVAWWAAAIYGGGRVMAQAAAPFKGGEAAVLKGTAPDGTPIVAPACAGTAST